MCQSVSVLGWTSVQEGCVGNCCCILCKNSESDKWKEREQKSAMLLVVPGVKIECRTVLWRRAVWASWHRRKAGVVFEDVEPFADHDNAGVLSVAQRRNDGEVVVLAIATAAPVTSAASSKSLFVREPLRLEAVSKACRTLLSKGTRHAMGLVLGGDRVVGAQKPPMPSLDASVAPINVGGIGTIEAKGTGCRAISCAIDTQSRRDCLTNLLRRSRGERWSMRTCCRMENRYFVLCRAGAMLLSSPSSFCQRWRDVRVWLRNDCRRCFKRSTRCCGRLMVIDCVSISHPNMRLRQLHAASPFSIFDSEMTARRCELGLLEKMLVMAWKSARAVGVVAGV